MKNRASRNLQAVFLITFLAMLLLVAQSGVAQGVVGAESLLRVVDRGGASINCTSSGTTINGNLNNGAPPDADLAAEVGARFGVTIDPAQHRVEIYPVNLSSAGTVTVSANSPSFNHLLAYVFTDNSGVPKSGDNFEFAQEPDSITQSAGAGKDAIVVANLFPNVWGSYTLTVSCTGQGGGGGGGLSAPSDLTATSGGSSQINLNWQDNSGNEDNFRVERKTMGGSFAMIADTAADATSYMDTTVDPATTYTYRVRAENSPAESAYSNEATATTNATPQPCVNSDTTICLLGDRFGASIEWNRPPGVPNLSPAFVSDLQTDSSGLFFFGNPNNLEFLVKIVNGCSLNQHFWVFYAATTDVQFTLTVVDSETGLINTYTNPTVMPAETITDTSAFATCP